MLKILKGQDILAANPANLLCPAETHTSKNGI